MICKPCKTAGNALRQSGNNAKSKRLHSRCEAPSTCTCQHKLTPVIKKEVNANR